MTNRKKPIEFKKVVVYFSIIGFLMLLTPIIIFTCNFYDHESSNKISEWGAFGDFFGGILNTILSLISLVVLGYITFLISKMSSIENKNLFLFQRRIEAYEELAKYIPRLNTIPKHLTLSVTTLKNRLDVQGGNHDLFDQHVMHLVEQVKIYHDYHFFLFNFNVRYNHLFIYNFDSETYNALLASSKKLGDNLDGYLNKLSRQEVPDMDLGELVEAHSEQLANFVNELKEELE